MKFAAFLLIESKRVFQETFGNFCAENDVTVFGVLPIVMTLLQILSVLFFRRTCIDVIYYMSVIFSGVSLITMDLC